MTRAWLEEPALKGQGWETRTLEDQSTSLPIDLGHGLWWWIARLGRSQKYPGFDSSG